VERPKVSDALTEEQKQILQQRGVLSPEEVHRLASKTRAGMGGADGKADCHSDAASSERAQALQAEKLDPVSLEPLESATLP